MLSLYLHIPFCQSKCNYCAFTSFPIWENLWFIDAYLWKLKEEIECYWKLLWKPSLKTLYIWWWTPNLIWADKLIDLISFVWTYFDVEDLWELSFEFNPYPEEEIYSIIQSIQKVFWKKFPRVRFSFGIQSFDNEVLQLSWRKSSFIWLVDFLRWLRPLKEDNTVFNFDFIAFWKWNKSKKWNKYLWSQPALDFFHDFAFSQFADSFSLYTLELFDNQNWKKKDPNKLISWAYIWTDDDIYEEFSLLKNIILDAWYSRYEISNFALSWKSSIHNRVYWEMDSYLGLWLNASSFLKNIDVSVDLKQFLWISEIWEGIRFRDVNLLKEYIDWITFDKTSFEILNKKDFLIESFFLWLRTDRGVKNLSNYNEILVSNYIEKLHSYEEEWLVIYNDETLQLTDAWMDVFNALVTDIMNEI